MTPRELIFAWLQARLPAPGQAWLSDKAGQFAAASPESALFAGISAALRHSGKGPLNLSPAELKAAASASEGWNPSDWTLDQGARIFLLLNLPAEPRSAQLLDRMYETADVGEALALQKALPLLPHPTGHMHRAREAIRSNIKAVFEAVTLRNPYPALHFDETGWNQMVVKTFFMESPLSEVWGLDRRANPALAGILADLALERWAAGRTFSPLLWRCVSPHADAKALGSLKRALASGKPAERKAAALALQSCPHPDAGPILASDPALAAAAKAGTLTWENYDVA